MNDKKSVAIYACGGAGTNLANQIEGYTPEEGFADPLIYYVDTSNSNLRRTNIDMSRVYLFDGVDGSGKERSENSQVIAKHAQNILLQFQPTAFNIIVCSASGGSGAVIGHTLAAELRKRGEQVIMLAVGTTGSVKEIENTIKSLKSLDGLASKIDKPMVVHYLQNSATAPRPVIDAAAKQALVYLLGLFSGQNKELDTADLKNWLNHPELDSQVVSLQFTSSDPSSYAHAGDVISVATLATPEMNTLLDPVPAYQAVGFVPSSWLEGKVKLMDKEPIHYTISPNLIEDVVSDLNKKLHASQSRLTSRVRRDSLVSNTDNATGDGMVL